MAALPAAQMPLRRGFFSAFRLLVRTGPAGLPAGTIAERVGVPPATLSFHLKELERAGLLSARRESRQIYYAPDIAGMRGLLAFLTEDCCGGHPEICSTLMPAVSKMPRQSSAADRDRR